MLRLTVAIMLVLSTAGGPTAGGAGAAPANGPMVATAAGAAGSAGTDPAGGTGAEPAGGTGAEPAGGAGEDARLDQNILPVLWRITRVYHATPDEVAGVGRKLGVSLAAVSNYELDCGGHWLGLNIMLCASEGEAQRVLQTLRDSGMLPEKFERDGRRVYELRYRDGSVGVARKMKDVLGLLAIEPRTYHVRVQVAPIGYGDDTRWNDLFNALVAQDRAPEDPDAVMAALDLATAYPYRDELALPAYAVAPDTGYRLSPAPLSAKRFGDEYVALFRDLPAPAGVPRVDVDATITVSAFTPYRPAERFDPYQLIRSSDPWPASHREVNRVFFDKDTYWLPEASPLWQIEYIHAWIYRNIRYDDGGPAGTRRGVVQTIQQERGRCWDLSDVFVAACRGAEIPARQVGGWIYGGEGHVWAQAYTDSLGWVDVDCTVPYLGVTADYVPLWMSLDGHPPLVYATVPEIEPAGAPREE